jgi:virginiamycin B lyase
MAASLWGITSGPDGNVWFAEGGANRLAWITRTGEIHEIAPPIANGNLVDLATGDDGNIWFTEFDGNKIGRLTP